MYEELNTHGIDNEFQGEVIHNMQNYDSIYQCLSVLFKVSDLTEEEKNILKLLTIFPISGVSFDDFMELCEIENGMTINRLIKRSFILHDYSTDKISLHPLISGLVEKEIPITIDEASVLIHNVATKYDWNMMVEEKEKLFNISYNIYNKFKDFDIQYGLDFKAISDPFRDFNKVEEAKEILFKLKDLYEKDIDNYLLELCKIYGGIGYWYLVIENNPKIDSEYILKQIELLESTDKYPLELGYAYRQLSERYMALNELDKAKDCVKRANTIYSNTEETSGFYWGGLYITFAKLYFQTEEHEKALEYANKAYKTLFNLFKVENADISSVYRIKGLIYIKLGRYEEAEELLEKSYKIRLKHAKKYNSSPLRSLEPLLEVYILNKKYEKAKVGYEDLYDTVKNYYINSEEWLERIKEKIEICNKEVSK